MSTQITTSSKTSSKTVPDIYDFINSIQDITGWVSLTEAFGYVFRPTHKTREELLTEFEQYWRKTHASILRKVSAKSGSFGIDIGCGNGQLLESAQKKQIEMVGLTLSPAQAKYGISNGLTVRVMPYTDPSFLKMYKGKADFVTLVGSVEHFTNPYLLAKQERAHPGDKELQLRLRTDIYKEMFRIISGVLKPKGKVYISCCAFNSVHPTPTEIIRNPIHGLLTGGIDGFHSTLLQRVLYGYYPDKDMLASCAKELGFALVEAEDGTKDYYQTSRYWWYLLYHALAHHPLQIAGRAVSFFARSPYHAWITLVNTITGSWPWQFRSRKQGSPVILERLVFQKK